MDKEPGMVVHPGFGNWQGTLVNAVAFHFQKNGFTSDLDRVGLVHRIDKDTSGLIVLAKNEYALSFLAKQFFDRKTKRLYWAFVWGNLENDEGTIRGHIGRHQKNRMQMAVYEDGSQGTLVNAVAFHFQKNGFTSDLDRVGLVHRIDKDTSGLIVLAKNEYALSFLAKQFFDRKTKRLYWAFVWGNLENDAGTIRGHIGRHQKNRMQMAVYGDGSQGKHAVTHYKVLERFKYMTWVECKLETGRTHQIRAHFKHIGHTLFNDERYEGHQILRGVNLPKYKQFVKNVFEVLPRHALHAHTLGFIHPTTKKEMYFESPMPKDMQDAVEKWRNYLQNS